MLSFLSCHLLPTFVKFSLSGTIHIPGGGSLYMLMMSLATDVQHNIVTINQFTNNVIMIHSMQYIELSGVSCSARHTPLQKIIQEVELGTFWSYAAYVRLQNEFGMELERVVSQSRNNSTNRCHFRNYVCLELL